MSRRLVVAALLLAATAAPASADERILDYHSDIAIAADGAMTVTETIRVRAEGDRIRHGIYRDFPTDYRDPLGHRYKVAFEPILARRDGADEPWHAEARSNGIRVYLGDRDATVPAGEHTYELRYGTSRQLGFFDDHDELYWNVTGNGWDFPIDHASAQVALPRAVPAGRLKAFGYTGPQGSREAALDAATFDGGARYAATRGLGPREGLSIVLEFPRGIVAAPTRAQRLRWLLADNAQLLVALAGLALLWLYYGWAWVRYGRDPAPGVRMPVYEPPPGFSPASLRFVRRMGYDKKTFAAALLGLAAKGWLDIDEDPHKVVTLRPTGKTVAFAPGEKAIVDVLFPSPQPVTLKQSIHSTMQAALKAHKASLAADYEKKYFDTHKARLVPGLLVSVATLLAAAAAIPGETRVPLLFICVWLSGWSVGTYGIASAAIASLRGAHGVPARAGALAGSLFALPFVAGELLGLGMLAWLGGVGFLLAFAALIGTNIAFYHWMKAPTQDGARLLDSIEGFRWYLGVAEKQELDARYRLDAHPELFGTLLPYAFALDVEQAWARRFAEALPLEAQRQAAPAWYHGGRGLDSGGLAAFTGGLGSSLTSAVSSASTSPGSSSGSSGGSGGGGGGGGGGGW